MKKQGVTFYSYAYTFANVVIKAYICDIDIRVQPDKSFQNKTTILYRLTDNYKTFPEMGWTINTTKKWFGVSDFFPAKQDLLNSL